MNYIRLKVLTSKGMADRDNRKLIYGAGWKGKATDKDLFIYLSF